LDPVLVEPSEFREGGDDERDALLADECRRSRERQGQMISPTLVGGT
jgi:hypothetical protein